MPRVSLKPENKSQNPFDYPKLTLDHGERARILLIEVDPMFEYVHTLKAPQIINGEVQYEPRTKRNGEKVEVVKKDFIGRHICHGRTEVISAKGVDVDQCPVCRASTETEAVVPPERRFAVHVIRYKTKPGSFEVQEPFSVELLAWAFGDKVFDTLADATTEWKDMRRHDLKLGPCENKQFQKFDIQVAGDAAWLADAKFDEAGKIVKDASGKEQVGQRGDLVLRTLKENAHPDLSVFIGRRLPMDQVQDDLDRVLKQYQKAFGRGSETVPEAVEVDSSMDIAGLLSEPAADAAVAAPAEEKSEEPVAAEAGAEMNFDDILAGLE